MSLFGFDPNGDHFRITREIPGRRINLAVPEASLLLQKSVGSVPHTGGKRFDMDSEYAQNAVALAPGRHPNDSGEIPKVTKVEIFPAAAVLDGQGATQRILVRAHYSDGTDRDVTSLAAFSSNNDNSAAPFRRKVSSRPRTAAKRSSWRASTRTPSASHFHCPAQELDVPVGRRGAEATTSMN